MVHDKIHELVIIEQIRSIGRIVTNDNNEGKAYTLLSPSPHPWKVSGKSLFRDLVLTSGPLTWGSWSSPRGPLVHPAPIETKEWSDRVMNR